MTMKEQALAYLERGWSVIPLHSPEMGNDFIEYEHQIGKVPLLSKREGGWTAYQDRLPTREEVEKWWTRWPKANIGVVTGKVSKVFVLDYDSKEDFPPHEGRISYTGVGYHLWYPHPMTRAIRNRIKITLEGKEYDIRGDGGYVVVPPSVHRTGVEYIWISEKELTTIPRQLLGKIDEETKKHIQNDYADILKGVGEGQRHGKATQVVGHWLHLRIPEQEVRILTHTWNRNNRPPLPIEEIDSVVETLAESERRRELTKQKDPTAFLSILLEQAMPNRGWLKEWVDYCDGIMETPREFLFFCGLAGMAGITGKRVWIPEAGDSKIFPNLWICALGPSSIAAKSTAVNLIRRAIATASVGKVQLPDNFTLEQFWKSLSDMSKSGDASALIVQDEFGTFLTQIRREYNSGTMELLTKLYDYHEHLSRKTLGRGEEQIDEPSISLLAASTLQWFRENLKESDIRGGFVARIGFAFSPGSTKRIPHRKEPISTPFNGLILGLRKIFETPAGTMAYSPQAESIYSEWYYDQATKYASSDLLGHFWGRYRTIAKKASMLYALSFDPTTREINVESMELALRLTDYHLECAEYLIQNEFLFNAIVLEAVRVEKFLQECPNGSDIKGVLRSLHMDIDYFSRKVLPHVLAMGNVTKRGEYLKWIGPFKEEESARGVK